MTRSETDLRPGDVLFIDLDLLDDNPFQPRTEMDPIRLAELASSIAKSGLLQPIAVRPNGPGRYQIVAGHRRVAAFKKLRAEATTEAAKRDYQLIRAHVVEAVSDAEMALSAYVENAQRDNLNPFDEAAALARIRDMGGYVSATEVAKATSQPERRVRRLLRLSTAPQVVKECVTLGVLVEVSEPGEPPKRERRRIDLMAALEFIRLHEHYLTGTPHGAGSRVPGAKTAPQRKKLADDRTTTAMTRALTHNWGLRRVVTFVDGIINNGISPADPITDTHRATAATAPPARDKGDESGSADELRDVCSSSSERFTLYLGRLKAATHEQLTAAQDTIDDVRQLIAAQLTMKGQGG